MLSVLTCAVCDKDQIINKIWPGEVTMEQDLKG